MLELMRLTLADVLLLLLRPRCLKPHERIQIEKYADREQDAAETHKDYECDGSCPQDSEGFDEKRKDQKTSRELQPSL